MACWGFEEGVGCCLVCGLKPWVEGLETTLPRLGPGRLTICGGVHMHEAEARTHTHTHTTRVQSQTHTDAFRRQQMRLCAPLAATAAAELAGLQLDMR